MVLPLACERASCSWRRRRRLLSQRLQISTPMTTILDGRNGWVSRARVGQVDTETQRDKFPVLRLLKVGLGVDINSTGIFEAQLTRSSWLKKIDSAATERLNISVSPKDDLAPGFYTVTGILAQVAN